MDDYEHPTIRRLRWGPLADWPIGQAAAHQQGEGTVIRRKPFLRRYWSSYRAFRRLGYSPCASLRTATPPVERSIVGSVRDDRGGLGQEGAPATPVHQARTTLEDID
jgi:hypothetical protein